MEPAVPTAPAVVVEPEVGGANEEKGLVVVRAVPWGRITEMTDVDGFSISLPDEVHTPVAVRLDPGVYRVTVEYAEGLTQPSVQTCEVEVGLEQTAECFMNLAEVDPMAYFKETGWWR